jgi:hypothetical protein
VCRYAERSPSATAAGEPSPDKANEQRISDSRRKQKGRRLLAGGSGLGHVAAIKKHLHQSVDHLQQSSL